MAVQTWAAATLCRHFLFNYSPSSEDLLLDVLPGRPDKGCVPRSRHFCSENVRSVFSVSLYRLVFLWGSATVGGLWRCFSPHVC